MPVKRRFVVSEVGVFRADEEILYEFHGNECQALRGVVIFGGLEVPCQVARPKFPDLAVGESCKVDIVIWPATGRVDYSALKMALYKSGTVEHGSAFPSWTEGKIAPVRV